MTEAPTVEADPRERFRDAKFVLLTSYKRDGTGVPTQMWCVYDGGRLYVRTASTSYKVKRLARNPTVEVAPCDLRGDPTTDSFQARAERQPANEATRVAKLFARKYPMGYYTGICLKLLHAALAKIGVGEARGDTLFYEIVPDEHSGA